MDLGGNPSVRALTRRIHLPGDIIEENVRYINCNIMIVTLTKRKTFNGPNQDRFQLTEDMYVYLYTGSPDLMARQLGDSACKR